MAQRSRSKARGKAVRPTMKTDCGAVGFPPNCGREGRGSHMIGRGRISYARSGDVSIAYQVVGDGPRDIVLVPGWVSNLEAAWEDPDLARAQERLASFSRLILFDKRGTGLSDRVPTSDLPSLETRMDDVRAVM